MSLCFRYVDKNMEIREKFATVLDLEWLTGKYIAQKTLDLYEESGINLKQSRGHCYAGAPNMQSEKKGVASFILKNRKRRSYALLYA